MRRLHLKTLAAILAVALVLAYFFYEAALYNSNEVTRGIYENLAADAIVIGFTVTVIDTWNRIRTHKYYKDDEQLTLNDVQTRVFLCVSVLAMHLANHTDKDDESSPQIKNAKNITEVWYESSKTKLSSAHYENVTKEEASQVIRSINDAAKDIDMTISRYEKSLEGESFKALRDIHRKLDVAAMIGLELIADGVMVKGSVSSQKLSKRGAHSLQEKVRDVLKVAELAEKLSSMMDSKKGKE